MNKLLNLHLREPGSPGRTCTPITGYFHNKTKIFLANLRVDYYLLLKYYSMQDTALPLTWARSFTKFNPKCKILIVFGLKLYKLIFSIVIRWC